MDKLLNMLRYKSEGSDIDFKSTQYRFNNGSEGNDSNFIDSVLCSDNAR
jgi:hypothetical protein